MPEVVALTRTQSGKNQTHSLASLESAFTHLGILLSNLSVPTDAGVCPYGT